MLSQTGPKLATPGDVAQMRAALDEAGLRSVRLFGIVTLWHLRETGHLPGLDGLIFGAADFATDLGVTLEDNDFAAIRQEIVLIARRLGVAAIDSPCVRLDCDAALERELVPARRLGLVGKIAINPRQVPRINACFGTSEADLERARFGVQQHEAEPERVIPNFEGRVIGPGAAASSAGASRPARQGTRS
jgi:citrate lyase beta subunit